MMRTTYEVRSDVEAAGVVAWRSPPGAEDGEVQLRQGGRGNRFAKRLEQMKIKINIHRDISMYVCMYVCMYACMYLYIYIYIYVAFYTYTCM